MGERIYRTADGRHVTEGDPDAAFLAYSQFDDPPKDVLAEIGDKAEPEKKAPAKKAAPRKQAKKSADKQRTDSADK